MFGLILLATGLALLFRNMGIISVETWDILWPVFIIIAGLKHTYMMKKKGCCPHKTDKE